MAAADAMIDPQSDFDVAVDFLKRWMLGGPWVLTAINPSGKGIQTFAFVDLDRLRNSLVYWSDKRWGVYFAVNPDRRDPAAIRSKAAKADIAEARWLHIDIDLYKDGRGRGEVLVVKIIRMNPRKLAEICQSRPFRRVSFV